MMKKTLNQKNQKEISSITQYFGNSVKPMQKHKTAPSQSKLFKTATITKAATGNKNLLKRAKQNQHTKITQSNEFKTNDKMKISLDIQTQNKKTQNVPSVIQSTEIKHKKLDTNYKISSKNTSPLHSLIAHEIKIIKDSNNKMGVKSQFNSQKNKKIYLDNKNLRNSNTPKSTRSSENSKNNIDEIKQKPIDNNPSILNNDIFLQKILTLFVALKPNGENGNKNELLSLESNNEAKLRELTQKIKLFSIPNSNSLLTALSSINSDSQQRKEIYKIYFDFIFSILEDIKHLASEKVTEHLNQIEEVNSTAKLTNTCNIEESQLEEKSNMIIPIGNININTNIDNVANSFTQLISSISSDYYQKIIYEDYENNIFGNNANNLNSFEISNQIQIEKEKSNLLDNTPIQFIQRKKTFMSTDKTLKMSQIEESELYNIVNDNIVNNENFNKTNKQSEVPLPVLSSIINTIRKGAIPKETKPITKGRVNLTRHVQSNTDDIPRMIINKKIGGYNMQNNRTENKEDNGNCIIF